MCQWIRRARRPLLRDLNIAFVVGALLLALPAAAQNPPALSAGIQSETLAAGPVPGALVCPDIQTVQFMFRWFADHWTEAAQDFFTNGQSRLTRGEAASSPRLDRYGCALLAPGTPVLLEATYPVPVVAAKLANGKVVRGTTLPSMVVLPR